MNDPVFLDFGGFFEPLLEGGGITADHRCEDEDSNLGLYYQGPLWMCRRCIRAWHFCHLLFGTDNPDLKPEGGA